MLDKIIYRNFKVGDLFIVLIMLGLIAFMRFNSDVYPEVRSLEDMEHVAQLKMAKYALWSLLSSLLVGCGTILISVIVYMHGVSSSKSAHIQSKQELRAYVHTDIKVRTVENLNSLVRGIIGISNPPNDLIYDVSYTNFGQTPAHVYNTEAATAIASYPFPAEEHLSSDSRTFHIAKQLNFRISIGPGSKHNLVVQFQNHIPHSIFPKLQSKQFALYVFGAIYYEDVFGEKHFTRFRYAHYILHEGGKFTDDIEAHYQGNDAT